MKKIVITLFTLVLLFSCKTKKTKDTQTFISAYRILDQMVPYPYVLQQKNDSISLFNNQGVIIDKIEKNTIEDGNTLKFEKQHYKVFQKYNDRFLASNVLDTLLFRPYTNGKPNPKNGAVFKNVYKTQNLDLQKLKKGIKTSVWKYNVITDENSNPNTDLDIERLLHFKNDSVNILTKYYYKGLQTLSEFETKAYFVFEIDAVYFLSFQKEEDNPQPIYQITAFDGEAINLQDFSSKEVKNISYKKAPIDINNFTKQLNTAATYSNCFDGFQGEYYYSEDVTFNKGNQYILDYVNSDAPITNDDSGYIIVHFNINCNGDVGRFGLLQMDRNYKKKQFSKEMVNHVLKKVSLLKDFPNTHSQLNYIIYKDVHAFLMFKLSNGKIIDLCP